MGILASSVPMCYNKDWLWEKQHAGNTQKVDKDDEGQILTRTFSDSLSFLCQKVCLKEAGYEPKSGNINE